MLETYIYNISHQANDSYKTLLTEICFCKSLAKEWKVKDVKSRRNVGPHINSQTKMGSVPTQWPSGSVEAQYPGFDPRWIKITEPTLVIGLRD